MTFSAQLAKPNEPRVSVLADMLVDALAKADFGAVFSFQDLRKVIFEDPQSSRGNSAIQRAKRKLLREFSKSLVSVRGKGYQIAYPREQHSGSVRKIKASRRRQREALALVTHVEMEKLTPQERQQVSEASNRYALMLAINTRLARTKALPVVSNAQLPSGKQLAALLVGK